MRKQLSRDVEDGKAELDALKKRRDQISGELGEFRKRYQSDSAEVEAKKVGLTLSRQGTRAMVLYLPIVAVNIYAYVFYAQEARKLAEEASAMAKEEEARRNAAAATIRRIVSESFMIVAVAAAPAEVEKEVTKSTTTMKKKAK